MDKLLNQTSDNPNFTYGRKPIVRWPSDGSITIEDIVLIGESGDEIDCLAAGEKVLLRMEIQAQRAGYFNFLPSATLYRTDGLFICHFNGDVFPVALQSGESHVFDLNLGRIGLANADYMWSASIFDGYISAETRYDLVSNIYEFCVQGNNPLGAKGVFQHPFQWQLMPNGGLVEALSPTLLLAISDQINQANVNVRSEVATRKISVKNFFPLFNEVECAVLMHAKDVTVKLELESHVDDTLDLIPVATLHRLDGILICHFVGDSVKTQVASGQEIVFNLQLNHLALIENYYVFSVCVYERHMEILVCLASAKKIYEFRVIGTDTSIATGIFLPEFYWQLQA